MNEAKAKLDAGNLDEAIQETLSYVRSKPTDVTARTFLFELSCFSGDWERGEKQLDVIGQQDMKTMIGSQVYKQNFQAERDRIRHFSESLIPECLMPPPKYVENLLQANNRIREGNIAEARDILDKLEDQRPRFSCTINGEEVSDFRDYNDLTMCVFEVFIKGSYTWIPFEQVKKVVFTKPKTLRDLFWIQAEVEMNNGTNGEMFFPVLYVNSHKSGNDKIRLGRMTDWKDLGEDIYLGEGMRVFWHDGSHRSILELEEIKFKHEE